MTYPFNPDHLPGSTNWGNLPNTVFSQNSFVQYRHLTVCSSIAAAASHHHKGSRLIYGTLASISLRPRVPSWIWIRGIQYATHRNSFTSPPKLAISDAMQILLRHLATSSPLGNIFWRHSRFSPKQPEPQTHGDYNRFCPQTENTTFATLWRTYLPQHIPQCLKLTMHFSLRNLAAKMLSPLHNNFISFPYFFPSYKTCSINVNPLFHAANKIFI